MNRLISISFNKTFRFCSIFLLSLIPVTGFSNNCATSQNQKDNGWAYFQLGIYPGFPESQDARDIHGMRFGFPVSSSTKETEGLELSILWSASDRIYGSQLAVTNSTKYIEGAQIGAINCIRENSKALQFGAMNISYFDMSGLHLGAINMTGKKTVGAQVGAYNFSEEIRGFQFGVLNITNKSGLQFGLVNIIKDSFIPVLPLVNYK
jgi:hypothetical protein